MRLDGKVALITGAARGIGHEAARMFAAEGASVTAADVSEPSPPLDRTIDFITLDVTDEGEWQEVVAGIVERYGRIDVLVNNAGIAGSYDALDQVSIDAWDEVMAVNLRGPFLGMRTVVPFMRGNGGGTIVNVSSVWGFAGVADVSAYTTSKGAVRQLSKNAALTYIGDGIRVNTLCPGIADTPMIGEQDDAVSAEVIGATPIARMAEPREIAAGMLFLASDESSFMVGADLVVDGGLSVP